MIGTVWLMGLPADVTMASPPADADEHTLLATAAWATVSRLFLSQQERRNEVAEELGLHASDLIALFHMQPGEGVAQRALADHWSCDPSWVTTRIDRLEEEGLVERRLSPTDRRVKEVWLTPAGDTVRSQGIERFGRAPAPLADLPVEDLRLLTQVLEQLDLPDPTRVGRRAGN